MYGADLMLAVVVTDQKQLQTPLTCSRWATYRTTVRKAHRQEVAQLAQHVLLHLMTDLLQNLAVRFPACAALILVTRLSSS